MRLRSGDDRHVMLEATGRKGQTLDDVQDQSGEWETMGRLDERNAKD